MINVGLTHFLYCFYQFMLREDFTYNNKNNHYDNYYLLNNYYVFALCKMLSMDYPI